jgi:hypothetical protein
LAETVVKPDPTNGAKNQWPREFLDELRPSALLAACQVAPEQAGRFAPDLLTVFAQNPEAMAVHHDLKPCGPALLAKLATGLPDRCPDPISAAAVILAHDSTHAKAVETLKHLATTGTTGQALDAAYWLWKFAGDGGPFLSRAGEGLAAGGEEDQAKTAERLSEMGAAARPLGAALQAALRHPDANTRDTAGWALMKIAPELMPPIGE